MSDELKLNFLYHVFEGHARTFFKRTVRPQAQDYRHAIQLMEAEYVNESRQEECHREQENLRVRDVMRKQNIELARALDYIKDRIVLLNPQGPEMMRGDHQMRNYLADAVADQSWAQHALSRAVTDNWSMHKLYQDLCAEWSQYQKFRRSTWYGQRRILPSGGGAGPSNTYYNGQGTYGQPRQPGSRSSAPEGGKPIDQRTRAAHSPALV